MNSELKELKELKEAKALQKIRCEIYYKNNRDKVLRQKKEYYKKNKDKISLQRKEYYQDRLVRAIQIKAGILPLKISNPNVKVVLRSRI